MLIKNNLKIAFTFIGTLIGAGFASGREIVLYFGNTNVAAPIIACVLCALLAFVFLELGRKFSGDVVKNIFPKTHTIATFFISLSNFIVFSAMLAGAEFIGRETFGINGLGILSGIFSLAVILCGIESIKNLNTLAVPLIVMLILGLFIKERTLNAGGHFSLYKPFLYASMNILSGGLIIAKLSKGTSRKDSLASCAVIFIVLSILILVIYFISKDYANYAMPMLFIAEKYGLPKIGGLIIYLAIITTMVGALELTCSGNKYKATVALALGFLCSIWGFSNIVDTFYPVIGTVGAVLSVCSIIRLYAVGKMKQKSLGFPTDKIKRKSLGSPVEK